MSELVPFVEGNDLTTKGIEDQFRRVIEQSPFPVEILTLDGKIEMVNAAWSKLWKLNREETSQILKHYNMLEDKQIVEWGLQTLVKKGFSGEYVILPEMHYSGEVATITLGLEKINPSNVWVQCHIYPIKDTNGDILRIINLYLDISSRKRIEEEQKNILENMSQKISYLKRKISIENNFGNIIGDSEPLNYVLHRVSQVASTNTPVLITGETGTGKALIARAIHNNSDRSEEMLITVNCAALPEHLIESELFGHEIGAFTGASKQQIGRFEIASGSTLFLDEVGELSFNLQAKLLRVLDSGEYERLGSSKTHISNARIIAATNRVLEEEVDKGRFRADLLYRLKVFPISVPPLRDRPEDIEILANHFISLESKKLGKRFPKLSKNSLKKLLNYSWPGNVRELKNVIEVAMITSNKKLNFDLPKTSKVENNNFKTLDEIERDYIIDVLKAKNWKIGGDDSASSVLGLHVNTLRGKIKKLGIDKNLN